jgi:hypothetical protein
MYGRLSTETIRKMAIAKAQLAAIYDIAADEAGEAPDSDGLFRRNARDAASSCNSLTQMLDKRGA